MASKKITIVLVPDGKKKVRQFRIPRFLFTFFILIFLLSSGALVWVLRDYRAMRIRMPRLVQLEKENRQHMEQFRHLAQRIDKTTGDLSQLKEFDRKLKVMVNLDTNDNAEEFQGVGGSDPILLDPAHTMGKTHKDLVELMHRSLDNLDSEMSQSEQDKMELDKFLRNQRMLLASTPSVWPTKGWLSSRFGYRISPFTGEKEFHRGLDISTRMGAPIVAPASGIVTSYIDDHGYGNILTVNHGYGVMTRYAHLKKALVKKGQHVRRGETIALVGDTGRTTGPHLHYEVYLNKVPVNPLRYILN